MSEGINNKVVQTFEDSISVKQQIIDNGSYEVLMEAGHALLQYIEDSLSGKGWLIKE